MSVKVICALSGSVENLDKEWEAEEQAQFSVLVNGSN